MGYQVRMNILYENDKNKAKVVIYTSAQTYAFYSFVHSFLLHERMQIKNKFLEFFDKNYKHR